MARPLMVSCFLVLLLPGCSSWEFRDATGTGVVVSFEREAREWVVTKVWEGSPADERGIAEGDRLLSVNGVQLPREVPPCQDRWQAQRVLTNLRLRMRDRGSKEHAVLRVAGRDDEIRVPLIPVDSYLQRRHDPGKKDGNCHDCNYGCPHRLDGWSTCDDQETSVICQGEGCMMIAWSPNEKPVILTP